MSKTSVAGPPLFTITCEPPPPGLQPPGYDEAMAAPGPAHMGWRQPEQAPEYVCSQPRGSTSVVYVTQNPQVMMTHAGLPHGATLMTCPSCREVVTTRVRHQPGCQTHMWAVLMCMFGCWPLCLLPYCCAGCQDTSHYCNNCGGYIGTVV